VGSGAEPYGSAPTSAFLLRNASVIVRKLRDSTGQPVQGLGESGRILGYPSYLDPFMPALANTAESIAFGDIFKCFIRIVNGVRFERSDEFRFQNDLVAFRCILRLDGALVDTGAVKTFVNTTLAAAVWPFRRNRQDRALFNVCDIWPAARTPHPRWTSPRIARCVKPPSGPASNCSQTPSANCGHRSGLTSSNWAGRVGPTRSAITPITLPRSR
jgi:Phage capsid family